MRNLLIRYLLGELNWDEQRELEQQLEQSPELQRELAQLQACFPPAGDVEREESAVPRGLAERTAGRVSDVACGAIDPTSSAADSYASPITGAERSASSPQWSLADLTVAAGVCLAVSMLLLPALRDSRDAGRRRVCANNLRQTGVYLAIFAAENGRHFPQIGPAENAGMYVQHLIEHGIVAPEEMATLRLCPGAPRADVLRGKEMVWRLPTAAESRSLPAWELVAIKRQMSPSYAYRLPFRFNGGYEYIPNFHSAYVAVMADAPSAAADDFMPENHGACFVQVLFQDNHVGTQKRCIASDDDDHLFTNDRGIPAAGCDQGDTVLGRSEATPEVIAVGRSQ